MKSVLIFLMLTIVAMFSYGCSSDPIVIKSVTNQAEIDKTKGRLITAQAAGFQLLWVIPIEVNSREERAYKMLLEKAGRDVISDVRITETWTYGYIGTAYTTIIEAMAYPRVEK